MKKFCVYEECGREIICFTDESDAHAWNQLWGWEGTYVAPKQ